MASIASGGSWPRQTRQDEMAGGHEVLCPRCQEKPETQFHRIWECSENRGSKAHEDSEYLISAAFSQHAADSCFWRRGLIPAAWTRIPPPPVEEAW
eukprot:6535748-Pyramimonas_sp.AAC.1